MKDTDRVILYNLLFVLLGETQKEFRQVLTTNKLKKRDKIDKMTSLIETEKAIETVLQSLQGENNGI